jgi:bacteriocin biosynthesis cyclodehydratase domain-containing protein
VLLLLRPRRLLLLLLRRRGRQASLVDGSASSGPTRVPHDPNEPGVGQEPTRFVVLPFQLIEREQGVVVRRGRLQVLVSGDRASEVVQTIAEAMRGNGATIAEVCSLFAAPDRATVLELVNQLLARNLVVPAGSDLIPVDREGPLDLFYWHVGVSGHDATARLNKVRMAIVGVNHVSHQLVRSLSAAGSTNFEIIDYSLLRNVSLFDDEGRICPSRWTAAAPVPFDGWEARLTADSFDCLIATSDFGGRRVMGRWNRLCLALDRHFLPVVLQDLVGYVGPLVVPRETACLECYTARLASNSRGADVELPNEQAAFDGQQVTGLHPSMASVLGDIAVIELTRFYTRALPFWNVATVTEVNLLASRIESRKVLRVPRCPACSTLTRRSPTSLMNDASRPGRLQE